MDLDIHPLTADRWDDFVTLFGPRGGDGGCWCMWNRQTSREFEERHGESNKAAMRAIAESDEVPGLLGYLDGHPVGWVSLAPRETYGRLQRSRVTKPLDNQAVWSITCFVIDRNHRRHGVASAMLDAAVEYARSQGCHVIEGYPVEPRTDEMPSHWAWMGPAAMFERAGFTEVARRSETRPFMRKSLDQPPA